MERKYLVGRNILEAIDSVPHDTVSEAADDIGNILSSTIKDDNFSSRQVYLYEVRPVRSVEFNTKDHEIG